MYNRISSSRQKKFEAMAMARREKQVAAKKFKAEGLTNVEIAQRLNISESSVRLLLA